MASASRPLHTMHDVFRHKKDFSFEKASLELECKGRKFVDSAFAVDPDTWYLRNHGQLLESLAAAPGIKLRVSLSDFDLLAKGKTPASQALSLLPTMLTLADLIVFSPGPLWYCNYSPLSMFGWPEFTRSMSSSVAQDCSISFNGGLLDFFAFHIALRKLIAAGRVAYLPIINIDWRDTNLQLPSIRRYETPFYQARNAFNDLYIDQVVSEQLGFHHVLSRTSESKIITSRISQSKPNNENWKRSHFCLQLRIPGIANASIEDILNIQEDEWLSFDTFRRSIQAAVDEATTSIRSESEIETHVKRIQRELIDDPLIKLEERLKRLEGIRRRKWFGYAMVSVTSALVGCLAPELAPSILAGLGTVTISKLMEAYFSDLEKDLGLSSETLYWLAKLRKGLKSNR